MLLLFMNLLIITISILISVAFYTILERKILSYIQLRKGPNKVGMMGILQPFSDALKLFNKNLSLSELTNYMISYITPALSLFMSIMMLPLITFNYYSMYDNKHNLLLFFLLSSMSVYFILMVGWSTNCKYSHMGAIRSIAQMISYEVSLFLIILFITILSSSYSFMQVSKTQMFMYFAWGNIILLMIWLITCLAETNRSPFDFAEGESELVSGFNIEYMGGWFALIFLAEYMSMIILMLITTIMFFTSLNSITSNMMMLLLMIMLLWVRGTYPRFRYDMLMKLSWKILLPISLLIIPMSMVITFYFV